jgi:hypothetical protein
LFKNSKKYVTSIIATTVLGLGLFSGSIDVLAKKKEDIVYDLTLPEGASELGKLYETPDGEVVETPSEGSGDVSIKCIVCGIETPSGRVTASRIYGTYTTNKLDQYLTSAWAAASSYTYTKGRSTTTDLSFSVSLTSDTRSAIASGFSYSSSVTKTYDISISIPADSRKESKLALYGDYNTDYIAYSKKDIFGKVIEQGQTYAYEPTSTHYLRVVYK